MIGYLHEPSQGRDHWVVNERDFPHLAELEPLPPAGFRSRHSTVNAASQFAEAAAGTRGSNSTSASIVKLGEKGLEQFDLWPRPCAPRAPFTDAYAGNTTNAPKGFWDWSR
jgi:hypothetical protein